MNANAIGFMDSGIGGLTVVKEVMRQLPNESIIFLGDQARLPYGEKTSDEITAYSLQIAAYLQQSDIKMMVIACNTATAEALPVLQKELKIPVIGVIEPGATAAVAASHNRHIGVIATDGATRSMAYPRTIAGLEPDAQVVSLACPPFVPLVEKDRYHDDHAQQVVTETLQPLQHTGIDTLIMGCTHYPLLRAKIAQAMGPSVTLIDSGAETVGTIKQVLDEQQLAHPADTPVTQAFYTTGSPEKFMTVANQWLDQPIVAHHVDVDQLVALI